MKKSILLYSIIFICLFDVSAQSYDHSFTKTQFIKAPTENIADIESFGITEKNTIIKYNDGLGRAIQVVNKQATPNQNDAVKFWVYDNAGRASKDYLGYSHNSTDGKYKTDYLNSQIEFYESAIGVGHSYSPFAITRYEDSPLGRAIEQGGPGSYWQPVNGYTKTYSYSLNLNSSILKFSINSSGNLINDASNKYYAEDVLYYTEFKDEDGGKVGVYSDNSGKTVLKVSFDPVGVDHLMTYYVYDVLNRLRYIITPELTEIIKDNGSANLSWASNEIKNLAYAFKFDSRGRLNQKLVPGCEPVYYVYDNYDRIILEQDGNLRVEDKWKFVKFDNLSRPIITGIITGSAGQTQSQMQTTVDTHYESNIFNYELTDFQGQNSIHGYTNQAYPILLQNPDVYTVTYYDNYDFDTNNDVSFDINYSEANKLDKPVGLVTGGKVKILDGTNTFMICAVYYDHKYRTIQACEQNHLGGTDRQSFEFEFDGTLVSQNHEHKISGSTAIVENRLFDHDHVGRVKAMDYFVDSESNLFRMYSNTYNELGQLIEKDILTEETPSGIEALQSIDYKYNIRGWLKNINNSNINNNNTTLDYHEILAPDEYVAGMRVDTVKYEVVGYDDGSKSLKPSLTISIDDKKDLIISKISDSSFTRYYEIDEIETSIIYKSSVDSIVFAKLYSELSTPYVFDLDTLEFDQYDSKQMISYDISTQIEKMFEASSNTDTLLAQIITSHITTRSYQWTPLVIFNEDQDDIFGMDIKYNEGLSELGGTARYNGLISGVKWQSKENEGIRGYGYTYDSHNQLTNAYYGEEERGVWTQNNNYTVSGITYDLNGNIETLDRRGKTGENQGVPIFGDIDELEYVYGANSNQLLTVDDQSGFNSSIIRSFEDNASLLQIEFYYDANGNAIKDLNKGITSITYNVFNKPQVVTYSDTRSLEFTYNSVGKLLKYEAIDAQQSTIKENDYVSNFVYEGGTLKFFQMEEGRIVVPAAKQYNPEFYFKDYLGNIREVYKKGSTGEVEIVEEHHYYPFGMLMSGLDFIGSPKNPYLYQGKEFFEEYDFDLHYFGARMFDSELGRWHSNDPLIVFASPYNGMANNPVSMVDPTGMVPGGGDPVLPDPIETEKRRVWAWGDGWADDPNPMDGSDFISFSDWDSYSGGSVNPYGAINGNNGEVSHGGGSSRGSSSSNGGYKGGYTTKDMAYYNEMYRKISGYNDLLSRTNGGKIDQADNPTIVGFGYYGGGVASAGPGGTGEIGRFQLFSEPGKQYSYSEVGTAMGWDLGIGTGIFLIFGPSNLKASDLEGYSISASGGAYFGEGAIQTSANRDGIPTFKYIIIQGGFSVGPVYSGSIKPVFTTVTEYFQRPGLPSGYNEHNGYTCFNEGTEVFMINAFKLIEDIKIEDSIYSFCLETQSVAKSKVINIFKTVVDSLYNINVQGEDILVTGYHPFFVPNKGWVKVKDLIISDSLLLSDGKEVVLISKQKLYGKYTVFNIEVDNNHNYFVTRTKILVHNK